MEKTDEIGNVNSTTYCSGKPPQIFPISGRVCVAEGGANTTDCENNEAEGGVVRKNDEGEAGIICEGLVEQSIAKQIFTVYIPFYHFPEWVLDPQLWKTFDFHKTVVYYDKEENIEDVCLMVKEREPCNISMRRIYFEEKMQEMFGWKHGAYQKSTPEKLMPNIAIYCYATVLRPSGYKKIHVINLIGYAFDEIHQPDYIYFKKKSIKYIVEKYYKMWLKALYAALDLKKASKINKIKIFNVGGGAFAGPYFETFIENIFEPAFLPLMSFFKRAGIEVLGYDTQTKEFNGGYIPNILDTDEDVEKTLYVNAWDPWSLIGNGNERDRSLDGYWGRCSNMAVLGWSETNPYIGYRVIPS